jgi:hypothetical protein
MSKFFWEQRTNEAKADAAQALTEANRHERHIEQLENRLARTTLACQALWEILKTHVGLTEEELLAKMDEIDLRDGVRDGKMSPTVCLCGSCGRKVNSVSASCMYCGAELVKPHVFQS